MPKYLVTKPLYISCVMEAPDEWTAVDMALASENPEQWFADEPQPYIGRDDLNVCKTED